MSNIKQQTLKRALSMLDAIGAKYAIIDAQGKKYGSLDVNEKKRQTKYAHGELSSYCASHISKMSVGDVVEIPVGKYDGNDVRASAVSWACYHWGNGTVTTSTSKTKKIVEVLRIK